jgi:hypothetical protein
MTDLYVLDAVGEPVPEPDVGRWSAWFERSDECRVVRQEMVGDVRVSTVFLGMDHGYGEGPAVLWETMVFGGPLDEEQDRYTSRADALAGHAAMVAQVREAGPG